MSSIPLAPNAAPPGRTVAGADSYPLGTPMFAPTLPGTALDYTVQWGAWAAAAGLTIAAGAVIVAPTSGMAVLSPSLSPNGDLTARIQANSSGVWPVTFEIVLSDGSQQAAQVLLLVQDSVNTLVAPIASPAGPVTDGNGILVTAS